MNAWVNQVESTLSMAKDDQNAEAMKAYMRDQFDFLGIQSTPRRAMLKELFTTQYLPELGELAFVVDELWAKPEREYQLVAIDLLIKSKKKLPVEFFEHVERWITTKSWWDTVDMLATHIVGALASLYPDEAQRMLHQWRNSDDIWLRRTTILYQLKYKQQTNVDLLFEIIEENKHDNEFFIQKAIGWSLREYSKTDAAKVIEFIDSANIMGLARREGLKWLHSKGRVV